MINNKKGFNVSYFLILGLILLMMYVNNYNTQEEAYTNGNLVADLAAGKVSSVTVQPNEETPTGSARVVLEGGVIKTIYVTDVNELQNTLA